MNMPSDDIKDMLESESSLGLTFGTNLFIGEEPHSPDNCVTIFDTYGLPPQITFGGERYYRPAIQVRIRNNSYSDGWEEAHGIMEFLHGKGQETWNGTLYSLIQASGEPSLLDRDKNSRARFVVNFNIQRR